MTDQPGGITRQEITSQPEVWAEVLRSLSGSGFPLQPELPTGQGLFIGAGTSLYLARSLAHIFRAVTGAPLSAVPPSDLLVCPQDYNLPEQLWAVGISRSGTTTETVKALAAMKNDFGRKTFALTCHEGCEMTEHADHVLATPQAAEKSVVMTRSFTSMLLAMSRWAFLASGRDDLLEAQERLPEALSSVWLQLVKDAQSAVERFSPKQIVTFGQGSYYGLACEVALKVKEMAIQPSEPFHSLEYRHGPKSIANENTFVVALLSDGGRNYEADLLRDVKALGAKVWAIAGSDEGLDAEQADLITVLGKEIPELARLPMVLPVAQLFGLEYALSRGEDPDSPKNLTQVVTL